MKDILFSSWAGTVVDNRGGSDGSTKHPDAIEKIRMPEKLTETEPIRAFMGWDGFVLRSEDVHVVDLCRAYMEAVRNQLTDVPYDSKDPLYEFGFGLNY